jgi:Uma2 family endonuclease
MKTYDDLCRVPDDGNRYELIGGEIVASPTPTWLHQIVSGQLVRWLDDFVRGGGLGLVGFAPLDIRLSQHDVVQPDILYVSRERMSNLTSNGTVGAPDLVVEILSPETHGRDLGDKLELYARAEVREYWVVDTADVQIRPLALTVDGYQRIPLDGSMFRSRVRPGFELDVGKLFDSLDVPPTEATASNP